jgi:hypothetical protein
MTDALTWIEPAYRGGRLERLERHECERLLVTKNIGRLGFGVGGAQRIVVMNYVVTRQHVVLRTAPHTEAAHCLDGPVAFEVDALDEFSFTGWDVLVHGIADALPPDWLRAMDVGETPEPWADGMRSVYLRIPLEHLTGRRVHPV